MQATTVILLELSFGSVHIPEDEDRFVGLAKKSIRWFHAMSDRSIGSRRAWQLCDSCVRKLATGMKYNTDDLLSHPRPSLSAHARKSVSSRISVPRFPLIIMVITTPVKSSWTRISPMTHSVKSLSGLSSPHRMRRIEERVERGVCWRKERKRIFLSCHAQHIIPHESRVDSIT